MGVMRLRLRKATFFLICSFLFVWIITKGNTIVTPWEGHASRSKQSIEFLSSLGFGVTANWTIHGDSKIGDGKQSRPSVPVDSELHQEAIFIGVLSTAKQGKWANRFDCPGIRIGVRVVQGVNYTSLGKHGVLFIPRYSLRTINWDLLQKSRSPNQLWIFNSFESPIHTTPLINNWARFGFNWTFTYRTDSTFPSPYGRYLPGSPLLPGNDTTNWAQGKTEFAAWIGSNCHNTGWPRLEFVRRLQKYIPLDTFGACGTKTCPKNPKCGETLIKYKFYFALENSNCKDYITEKFWAAPMKNNMIPVVYGPSRGDYEKVAPPKSFIHVDDFETISELAEYLKLVDSDDSLFNQYFEWKKMGSVETDLIADYYHSRKVMCRIASRVEERRRRGEPGPEKLDMKTWWTDSCKVKKPRIMINKTLP